MTKTPNSSVLSSGPNMMSMSSSKNAAENSTKRPVSKKKTRPLKKAPQAPKRFKSSYILFFIHVQQRIKESLPPGQASAPEVSKRASELWKALSAEDRLHWDNEAAKEKQRYLDEKKVYTGPWQIPHKRAKKDPTAPKRNPSAFLLFSLTKRKELKDQNPTLKNTEISRILGELWRRTSDEIKAPFIQREEIERKKYKEEMSAWREKKAKEDKDKQREKEEDFRMKVREMQEGEANIEKNNRATKEREMQLPASSVASPAPLLRPQGSVDGELNSLGPIKTDHKHHNQSQSQPQSYLFAPHQQHHYRQEGSPLPEPGSYGTIDNFQYSTNAATSTTTSSSSGNNNSRQAQESWSIPSASPSLGSHSHSHSQNYQNEHLHSHPMNNMRYNNNQSPSLIHSHHSTQNHHSSHQMSSTAIPEKFNSFDVFQSHQHQNGNVNGNGNGNSNGGNGSGNGRDSFSPPAVVDHGHSFYDNHHQLLQQQHRPIKFEDSGIGGIGAIGGHESPYPYPEEFDPVPIH